MEACQAYLEEVVSPFQVDREGLEGRRVELVGHPGEEAIPYLEVQEDRPCQEEEVVHQVELAGHLEEEEGRPCQEVPVVHQAAGEDRLRVEEANHPFQAVLEGHQHQEEEEARPYLEVGADLAHQEEPVVLN